MPVGVLASLAQQLVDVARLIKRFVDDEPELGQKLERDVAAEPAAQERRGAAHRRDDRGAVRAAKVVNTSVNETLSRTLMTSLTTLLVLFALFIFGGKIIHSFAFTLIVGVLVGTYSSIYVASTVLLHLGVSKHDLLQVEKEGATAGRQS